MITRETVREAIKRLSRIRTELIVRYPFFGYFAMHFTLAAAEVKTACTDMKNIIFDPRFMDRLSDEELMFVMCHEVMHCALNHIVRRGGRIPFIWNVACDIVVNSNILQSMGIEAFSIDGQQVMASTPSGEEGYLYSAEKIYEMFMDNLDRNMFKKCDIMIEESDSLIDNHDYWPGIQVSTCIQDEMSKAVEESAEMCRGTRASGEIPQAIRRMVIELRNKKQVPWNKVCRDFIRSQEPVGEDYTYFPPDRRYRNRDILYPGCNPAQEEILKEVLFFVDKSASMDREQMMTVINELIFAVRGIHGLTGKAAFFDTKVSEFLSFSDAKDIIRKGVPVPGGGTSFYAVFESLPKTLLPVSGIVIMTDGYASFPPQSAAKGIPVLWIIVGTDVIPDWGKWIKIEETFKT